MAKTGQYNQRIKFQTYEVTTDDYGQDIKTWKDFVEVWANVNIGSQTRINSRDELVHINELKILIRYRTDLDPTMRIIWNKQEFPILGLLDPTGMREEIQIKASMGTPYL